MRNKVIRIMESWRSGENGAYSFQELLDWIQALKQATDVRIRECSLNDSSFWFFDDYNGEILNRKRSFFSIRGIRQFEKDELLCEQPIIVQPEIGYLGIICKEIGGVLHFLMQAKTEPGNVNCVQISPTLQATKSNFTRAHGGRFPAYIEYFENASRYRVLYDQIQSEQAARFYKKRNRNILIEVDEDIPVLPNYHWMTLGQIKALMRIDNLVNMDTRTVLSGLPLSLASAGDEEKEAVRRMVPDAALFRSMFEADVSETLPAIYQTINNCKMYRDIKTVMVPLNQLVDWETDEWGVECRKPADFSVRYYDIAISGREVQHWSQPLFKAAGQAVLGLIMADMDGTARFLVKPRAEIGSFDKIELGPGIQIEPSRGGSRPDRAETLFRRKLEAGEGILYDHLLSEEGGRFYHEQNRNVIMKIEADELGPLPEGYCWADYRTLNQMIQINNCVNIQLRNLLSLLEI